MQPLLSLCIPTVFGREVQFNKLLNELQRQMAEDTLQGIVEIIVNKDNKEISIGHKRQLMYEKCNGIYSVQIDDDDMVSGEYLKTIITACLNDDDCIGYIENCNINGIISKSLIGCQYSNWIENLKTKEFGCTRFRTPFFKIPIKTQFCLETKVNDIRFGEDVDFATRIYPLIKSMTFIPEEMYFYIYKTEKTHNERYGIK